MAVTARVVEMAEMVEPVATRREMSIKSGCLIQVLYLLSSRTSVLTRRRRRRWMLLTVNHTCRARFAVNYSNIAAQSIFTRALIWRSAEKKVAKINKSMWQHRWRCEFYV